MAEVFAGRGDSVLVFRGDDGLDEFTTTAPTRVWVVRGGTVTRDRARRGRPRPAPGRTRRTCAAATPAHNADVARRLLAGETGPVRDAVLLNAAAALAAHDGLSDRDLPAQLRAGIDRAAAAVDSGAATDLVARWAAFKP